MVTNLYTLIQDQPVDAIELVNCLAHLTNWIIEYGDEKLAFGYLKKSRVAIYIHELKNHPQEWLRRQLYYTFLKQVLVGFVKNPTVKKAESKNCFIKFVSRNLVKDRKQSQLEELVSEVQLLCEKLTTDAE